MMIARQWQIRVPLTYHQVFAQTTARSRSSRHFDAAPSNVSQASRSSRCAWGSACTPSRCSQFDQLRKALRLPERMKKLVQRFDEEHRSVMSRRVSRLNEPAARKTDHGRRRARGTHKQDGTRVDKKRKDEYGRWTGWRKELMSARLIGAAQEAYLEIGQESDVRRDLVCGGSEGS